MKSIWRYFHSIPLIIVVALVVLLIATTSAPAATCAPQEFVKEQLADVYGESLQVMALGSTGSLIQFFAAPDTGTWTLTGTNPSGQTCLLANGDGYEFVSTTKPPGDPT